MLVLSLKTCSPIVKRVLSTNRVQKCQLSTRKMDENAVLALTKQLAPPLTNSKHKGQAGRVGVVGGSLEYTGAPYFGAISALKVGADLAHVFCTQAASSVIKSYSPELIVHPLLDRQSASVEIEPWLDRLHVILIGPGLGREPSTFKVVEEVIGLCKAKYKPLVIDADALFLVSRKPQLLKNYPAPVILTPNAMELARLIGSDDSSNKREDAKFLLDSAENLTLICKGHEDEILNRESHVSVRSGGSGRRCGGQGDVLAGSTAIFLAWALENLAKGEGNDNRPLVAGFAACRLVRACNEKAFKKRGRSMTCTDMIQEIHEAFDELYELKP